jgi:predicted TIM-barrel fold metal-dependent hydrolase
MHALFDTHQHLIYRGKLGYAWAEQIPALQGQSFTLEDYHRLTAGKGVAGSLFMEVDADDFRAEAHHIATLAQDPGAGIRGLILSCRPESAEAEFDAWLERCTNLGADVGTVGLRRILHEAPDDLSQSPLFRRNLAKLGRRGLVFDLCVRADQLPLAAALVAACPDVSFVLDHCGVPDIAGGDFAQWRQGLTRMGGFEIVVCKISGVLAYCAEGAADAQAIAPYVAHVIESFGPDRALWGSDWPVVNLRADLPGWIDIFRGLIADLSDAEQQAICNGTAQRVYGVGL